MLCSLDMFEQRQTEIATWLCFILHLAIKTCIISKTQFNVVVSIRLSGNSHCKLTEPKSKHHQSSISRTKTQPPRHSQIPPFRMCHLTIIKCNEKSCKYPLRARIIYCKSARADKRNMIPDNCTERETAIQQFKDDGNLYGCLGNKLDPVVMLDDYCFLHFS